jgi:uncharacterized protein YgiM (DUF1202 family)
MTEEITDTTTTIPAEDVEIAVTVEANPTVTFETPKSKPWAEMTPDEKKEAHVILQGKKATTKKKIRDYSLDEAKAEIKRLDKTGQKLSVYYSHILKQIHALTHLNQFV